MPFINSEARHEVDRIGPATVGDKCYVAYRGMLRDWRAEPRWTTAHNIYLYVMKARRDMPIGDALAAIELAWQVFFQLHVMPYEIAKRTENGEIDY